MIKAKEEKVVVTNQRNQRNQKNTNGSHVVLPTGIAVILT